MYSFRNHYLLALLLLFALCSLASCDERNTPVQTEIELCQLETEALELATFLTNNYTKGDSIYFTRTNIVTNECIIEGFKVVENYFYKGVIPLEPDGKSEADEVGKEFIEYVKGYDMATFLQSEENQIQVLIMHVYQKEGNYTDATVSMNREYAKSISNYVEDKGDSLIIMHSDISCVLQKYVGIIRIKDSNYVWKPVL